MWHAKHFIHTTHVMYATVLYGECCCYVIIILVFRIREFTRPCPSPTASQWGVKIDPHWHLNLQASQPLTWRCDMFLEGRSESITSWSQNLMAFRATDVFWNVLVPCWSQCFVRVREKSRRLAARNRKWRRAGRVGEQCSILDNQHGILIALCIQGMEQDWF